MRSIELRWRCCAAAADAHGSDGEGKPPLPMTTWLALAEARNEPLPTQVATSDMNGADWALIWIPMNGI